jgi:hypothetical protein
VKNERAHKKWKIFETIYVLEEKLSLFFRLIYPSGSGEIFFINIVGGKKPIK